MTSRADRDLMASLKAAEPFTGFVEEGAKVQFLGRGEVAFYQEGERALLLEVLAGRGVIFARSIRRWDDGERVTEEEHARVVARVTSALRKLGATDVEVVST